MSRRRHAISGADGDAETLIGRAFRQSGGRQKVKRTRTNKVIGGEAERGVYFCQSKAEKNQPRKASQSLAGLVFAGLGPPLEGAIDGRVFCGTSR